MPFIHITNVEFQTEPAMQRIIAAAKLKNTLADNVVIKAETIRSRHKRGSLNPELGQGTPLPMAHIEPPCFKAVILKLVDARANHSYNKSLPCELHD
jgi:hypothetical protein